MNNLLYFVFSTFLLVQLCTAAFIPYQKYATYGGRSNRQHLVKQLGNNYIDEYETPAKKEGRIFCSFLAYHLGFCSLAATQLFTIVVRLRHLKNYDATA